MWRKAKHRPSWIIYAFTAAWTLIAPACGNNTSPSASRDAGTPTPHGAGKLTLSLDPTLDQQDGNVQATQLMSAALVDTNGKSVANAAIVDGTAVFDLAGVKAGDAFIVVNDDSSNLVPTRIDKSAAGVAQRVGQKLRNSYIGSDQSPSYRINTYPDDPVLKFSDSSTESSKQAYVLADFSGAETSIRVLGTASVLTSLALSKCPGHSYVSADAWLLNTMGKEHHGDIFSADGGAADCMGCHTNYGTKPRASSDVSPSNGWCFRCHAGPDGPKSGFMDPSE
jgi:hypothetical protein